jgi:ubiquinone/menaquinone biosynthesis C-methylase UbiE
VDDAIPDQIDVWESLHTQGTHDVLRHQASPFAELAQPHFKRGAKILELGCGVGRDAEYFAQKGHTVMATDGTSAVIEQNKAEISSSSVTFDVLDMRQMPWPYADSTFDVVYANLSLHYYSDEVTAAIVREARRVLRDGGYMAFACKSDDEYYHAGKKLGNGVYVLPDDKMIHFFSEDYMRQLVTPFANIELLDEIDEDYHGRVSKIVRCLAQARTAGGTL